MSKRKATKKSVPKSASAKQKPLSPADLVAGFREQFAKAVGSKNSAVQDQLINHTLNAVRLPEGLSQSELIIQSTLIASQLQEIKPQDGLEGMLAVQMVGVHHAAMECLRRAMIQAQTFQGRDQNLKHGVKLLAVFTRQLEALNKHRGKGQQKVTVEHVNVAAGGKAVVGNIESRRREEAPPRSQEEQRSVTYNPAETINLDTKRMEPVPAKRKRKTRA